MFTEITNPTNPLRIENFLRPYKRGEKEFTPEVARQILEMTNHPRNIRDTLQLIAEQPQEKQAQYKDVTLSAFDHREQPNDILILGKKLAITNDYEDKLNALINNDYTKDTKGGIVYASASNQIAAVITTEKEPDISQYSENISLYCTSSRVSLFGTDLSKIKSLKFKEGADVNLSSCQNFPADLDVSMCDKVDLRSCDLSQIQNPKFKEGAKVNLNECKNFPTELDLSMCDEVDLSHTDLSSAKSLKFKEGTKVDLQYCKNIPTDLDLSMCNEVDLHSTDLSLIKTLKFKEGSKVDLHYCENLPAELDLSMCNGVDLHDTDLSGVKNIKFKEGAEVYLYECKNFPAELDLSMCDKVNLSFTDLSSVKSLKFKEGTKISFPLCINFPAELDLSMCDKVNLRDSDLSSVKTLTFKNQQQQEDSQVNIPEDWQGKIIYADTVRTNQNTQEKKIENSDNKQRKNNVFLSLLHKITSRSR